MGGQSPGSVPVDQFAIQLLKKSAPARVITLSSMVHNGEWIDFDDLQSERSYSPSGVYPMTKLANELFTYELARRMEGTGVTANGLHPGVINTNLYRNYMGRSEHGNVGDDELEKGARTSVYLATSREVEGVSGKYFANQHERRSSIESCNREMVRKLRKVSGEMTGMGEDI